MSYCLNPNCQKPQNPVGSKFCQNCGSKLLLKEHYRALKLIGQGGFGRTFLAVDEDKPSKPRCVIKQFFPQAQGTNNIQKATELFGQEAARLDSLGKHPQIPELLDYFIQDGQQYLVQEFIDGQNLAQTLEAEGFFLETQIRELLNSLLPVVEFIHSHNVIHRDIKPENIICRTDGQLFLVDFGAAKLVTGTALARTGTIIGSAGYAAPEQAGGKAVFSSDLYSLGVTCIHLLTEAEPFDLYSFSEATWIWRDYLSIPVSKQLGQILDKMLEMAINRRYQLAAEVLKDLKLQPTTVTSKPPLKGTPESPTAPAGTTSTLPRQMQKWRCIQTLTGHTDLIYSIAISRDREILASASADKTIKIWQLNTGQELHTLWGHTDAVLSIAISSDGEILASGSADKTIKIWQLSTGRELRTLRGHSGQVYSVAINPNGDILVSGSEDKAIAIWQISTGRLLRTIGGWFSGHSDMVRAVAINPRGQSLASGSADKIIKIWQLGTGKELRSFTGHTSWVRSVAFSPDGQILASGSSDKTIKIWQVSTGWGLRSLTGHTNWVRSVAFSPDGGILASGSDDKTLKIWQLDTGRELCTLRGHSGTVYSVAFSRDGEILASGSADKTLKIWQRE